MKKIINHPETIVDDMIDAMILAHPDKLRRVNNRSIIARRKLTKKNKVSIISGGGSGHEPAHAGYVGKGMLDAAVLGEVFTSPSVDEVYTAIKELDNGEGVCLIVKKYTGDLLNFEMAAEMASSEGIYVEQVIVNDDVSLKEDGTMNGRRGIAGTIFVHKMAGAKAEQGASLQEVKKVAEKTIQSVRSIGFATSSCRIPSAQEPNFTLAENEMELGIGIHGERGIVRQKIGTAKSIAKQLVDAILEDIPLERETDIALMINGMGATPKMELYILYKEVFELLKAQEINVYQSFVGEYMTSLEMGGASVTILKLDKELKTLLHATSEAPSFLVR